MRTVSKASRAALSAVSSSRESRAACPHANAFGARSCPCPNSFQSSSPPSMHRLRFAVASLLLAPALVKAQSAASPRAVMPIDFVNSAEFGWLAKPVLASRVLDDMTQPAKWRMTGSGTLSFPDSLRMGDTRALRIDMKLNQGANMPERPRLPAINLQRTFD